MIVWVFFSFACFCGQIVVFAARGTGVSLPVVLWKCPRVLVLESYLE